MENSEINSKKIFWKLNIIFIVSKDIKSIKTIIK